METKRDWRNCGNHQEYESGSRQRFCGNCGDFRWPVKNRQKFGKYISGLVGVAALIAGTLGTVESVRENTDLSQRIREDYVCISDMTKEKQLELFDKNGNGKVDFSESEEGICYMGQYYLPK